MTPSAKKDAIKAKRKKMQEALPVVHWGPVPAANCWQFEYLGAIFEAGGDQMPDVRRRVAMARQRHGQMRHVWKSNAVHLKLKM